MHVFLILPDARIHRIKVGPFVRSLREAPLTLAFLAGLAPPELNATFRLVDESIETVPLEEGADLVGISVLTGTAPRAYALARHFRCRGIPVVLGGVHVTLCPEEAAGHADSIVIGPAEVSWPRLLRDFQRGDLQPVYRDEAGEGGWLPSLPAPRRDLIRSSGYMAPNVVMATRGCRHACDFCAVPPMGYGYQKRPVGEVVQEISRLPGSLFVFNDVSLTDDHDYARELFTAIEPLKKRWGGLATTRIADRPDLVELMARSGCRYLLIGFESLAAAALGEIHKGFNRESEYKALVDLLHNHGISIQGCFIFGFDNDDSSVFGETVDRVLQLRIDIPRYAILTPYPGTPLFRRLTEANRILTRDWGFYDTLHVVFQPALMSVDELRRGFKEAYRETYRFSHMFRRTVAPRFSSLVNLVGNLAYRRFARRISRDSGAVNGGLARAREIPVSKTDVEDGREGSRCRA